MLEILIKSSYLLAAALFHFASAFTIGDHEFRQWIAAVSRGEVPARQSLEQQLARRLAPLPEASVLVDDREAYRVLARAPDARPFLVPADSRFDAAVSAPRRFVHYLLLGPAAAPDSMPARYRDRPPAGFALAFSRGGYRLYVRRDPPPSARPRGPGPGRAG